MTPGERREFEGMGGAGLESPILVTDYAAVREILKHRSFEVGFEHYLAQNPAARQHVALHYDQGTIVRADSDAHAVLRLPVHEALSFRAAYLTSIIGEIHETFLAGVGSGPYELMQDLVFPMAMAVTGRLFGIPGSCQPRIGSLVGDLLAALHDGDTRLDAADAVVQELLDTTASCLRHAERQSGETFLFRWGAWTAGRQLPHGLTVANALVVFLAGYVTVAHFVGNAITALLRLPDFCGGVRSDGGLRNALQELLRCESPIRAVVRRPRARTNVGSSEVEAGTPVFLALGLANRDPSSYEMPEEMNLSAPFRPNLAFGAGPHRCPGALIARLQGESVLRRVLCGPRRVALDGEPEVSGGPFQVRTYNRVPVRLIAPG